MKLIRGIHNLKHFPALKNGCVLTIGNFDGVHLGHQQIINGLLEKAKSSGLPSVVMIFEPQPREFFAKQHQTVEAPARLMRLRDKFHYLAKLGVDYLLCLHFNQAFSQQQPIEFIENLLINQLHIHYLSIGDDFHFGDKRSGNFHILQQAGQKWGFVVENSHTFCYGEQRISSSLIRALLHNDDLAQVKQQLGRDYSIRGRVAHGNKLGRTIGFPTANVMLNRRVSPIQGVYAVRVKLPQGEFYGIANVGNRPTINGTVPLLEVHIFDFNAVIYGQEIEVFFMQKVRSEIKFASFEQLKQQITQDVLVVKDYFERELCSTANGTN
ncbi:bifunctional riboflavin kinase/FMN adenylyltransferase [Pasteurellaceae bacterium Macca]|nr:bifunctional riboflavin kinase/FMN adenylyltransferase [Pasteurellaceae bacterium Macca]